jgi:hypothetical protein
MLAAQRGLVDIRTTTMAEGSLRVQSTLRGPLCYMQLSGIVDERFDPEALVQQATGNRLVLNLKGVQRLTSFGVREWSAAMKQLSGKIERIYWVECSPAVVSQLNMVANFAGGAQVLSVQAPFYCEGCGTDTEIRCDLADGKAPLPENVPCPKCGKTMEFDDDPDSYFGFPRENAAKSIEPTLVPILRSLGVSFSGEEGEARIEDPTLVPSNRPTSVSSGEWAPPRPSSADRTRAQSEARLITSGTTSGTTTRGGLIDLMDRHWAVVVGLAVAVVLVALYLLLTDPAAM